MIYLCAKLAGISNFKEGFLFGFVFMVWLGIFDTFFVDWVLFANLPIFRLEGTEHMDKAYHQKWFHLKGALFPGLIFAVLAGLIIGALFLR